MKVLSWHGYLLSGSGSNVYKANLAASWRARGHEVILMCQERNVSDFDFVDEHGDFGSANGSLETEATEARPGRGRCTLLRPDIKGLLPVYVYDEYPGFEVKRFVDLTDEELETYVTSNVAALRLAIETYRPDATLIGHEVMGPYIAARALEGSEYRYGAMLHGSALEFAVKAQERYVRYASVGLGAASVVIGGSQYMVDEAASVVPGWRDRAAVVNPGCDVDLFRPSDGPRAEIPTVGYVGKLIAAKGVHHLLAALGLTDSSFRTVIVGYGGHESALHELAVALRAGDLSRARGIAVEGEGTPLEDLVRFLDAEAADPDYVATAARAQVEFTGRLEHGPLSRVLPGFDVLVAPSVGPEAFGLVVAESAACGVLPLVPRHSGIGEAGRALERHLGLDGLLTFDPRDPIRGIAGAVDVLLGIPPLRRRELGLAAAEFARARWSWSHVAESVLSLVAAR